MVGILFILGLVVVSGLVAYTGDYLGRKVGKAKMRLFGMRPKHTSILVAVVTGMIITAITITVLAVSSEAVRAMLFKFKQLREDLVTYQADLEESQLMLSFSKQQLDNMQTQLNDVDAKLNDAKTTIASQDMDIILKQEMLDEMQLEADKLIAERQDLDNQISGLNDSLSTARSEADDLNAQLSETQNLIAMRTMEIGDLESQRDQLAGQLNDLKTQTDQLKHDVAELEAAKQQLRADLDRYKSGGVKVYEGQILQEFTVPTSLTDSEIIKKIIGAKLIWDTEDEKNIEGNPMAEPTIEQYTDAINDINRYKDRFGDELAVIRIISSEHVFENEIVPIILKVERHLLIYDRSQIIARRFFNGGEQGKIIRNSLIEMLQDLELEAMDKGMIFEGIEEPVWADPTIIVETAKKASYYPNDFYINLVAKRDIYNTEYLLIGPDVPEYDNMKFVIEEIETETEWDAPP